MSVGIVQMPLLPKTPIRFLNRLRWWLPELARWVWDGKRFWLPAPVVVVICVLIVMAVPAMWPCHVERAVRLIGGILQLGGIITIVLKLRGAQRQFPGHMWALWWQRRPPFRVLNTVISAAGAALEMATGRARGRVTPGPQATLEQRLAMLEDSYTKLFV